MRETLCQKQQRFVRMIILLISYMHIEGYEVTFGHAERCKECLVGHKNSLHKLRLALDLNLFKDGSYLSRTEDHLKFGEYWENLGGTWGGRFKDGNHYSLAHNGME